MTESQEAVDTNILLTRQTAKSLLCSAKLNPFENTAEEDRTWSRVWTLVFRIFSPGNVCDQLWNSALLRTYDIRSGSQPDTQHRMLARAPRMALYTKRARRDTLETHVDHCIWKDTPYVSFTNSSDALQSLAEFRIKRNRGDQRIVVVDPRIRLEIGLPVLHCKEEMEYYQVPSRYRAEYWNGHYLCLWEVTPEEVVGVWDWNYLRSELNWEERIIMPAVEEHRAERDRRKAEDFLHHHLEVEDGGGYNEARPDSHDILDDTDSDGTEDNDNTDDDDTDRHARRSESENSDKRVCNENWTGELMRRYKDLRLN